jgi:hypothetical protein
VVKRLAIGAAHVAAAAFSGFVDQSARFWARAMSSDAWRVRCGRSTTATRGALRASRRTPRGPVVRTGGYGTPLRWRVGSFCVSHSGTWDSAPEGEGGLARQ